MSALSSVLGFARELIVARKIGISSETDAFYAAFTLVSTLTLLFLGPPLQGTLLPMYQRLLSVGRHGEAAGLFRFVLAIVAILTAVLAALLVLAAPYLVGLFFGGFSPEQRSYTTMTLRILALTVCAAGVGGVAQAILHTHRRFLAPAAVPPVGNLTVIGSALILGTVLGGQALSVGYLASGLLWAAILLPSSWGLLRGAGKFPTVELRAGSITFVVMALTYVFDSFSGIFQRSILSHFEVGLITALTLGSRVAGIPIGIFGAALAIVLFPRLAAAAVAGDPERSSEVLTFGIVASLSLLAPVALVLIIEPDAIIKLLFGGGRASDAALANVAAVLAVYAAGIPAQCLILIYERTFYAHGKAVWAVTIAVLTGSLQVVLTWYLSGPSNFGWIGVPLGTLVYAYVHAMTLAGTASRFVSFDHRRVVFALVRIGAAACIAGGILVITRESGPALSTIGAFVSGLVFFLTLYLMGERTWLDILRREVPG